MGEEWWPSRSRFVLNRGAVNRSFTACKNIIRYGFSYLHKLMNFTIPFFELACCLKMVILQNWNLD